MKWAFRNKTAEKKVENGDFQDVGYIRTIFTSSMFCENTRKSLNQQIWVWYISKY